MYGYILGAAGSGKTEYICRTLNEEAGAHPYKRYFLFVPEQSTLKAQQLLTAHAASGGILNLDVLSFQLLAYRVLEELGLKAPDLLDDMSRSMLIRRAVLDVAGELQVYGKSIDSRGFTSQISSLITEFYQYGVDEKKLEEVQARSESPLLKAKLQDMILIYGSFRRHLTEGVSIPEELPVILKEHLEESSILEGAEIIFDGFTGFTPVQMEIIEGIFGKAERIRFAFTIPEEAVPFKRTPGPEGVSDLFWLAKENIYKLDRLAALNGVKQEAPLYLKGSFGPERMVLLTAPDPVKEVRAAAESICRSCLSEKDPLRFRDVAVAIPSMEEYQELIRREFARAGIPCFMDENAGGGGTAVVRLIRSALQVLAERWNQASVMSFLRNPLCLEEADRAILDKGENQVRKRGIRGRRNYLGLAEEGVLPQAPVKALSALQEAFGKAHGNREKTEALRGFLKELQLEARLEAFCSRLREAGEQERAADEQSFLTHSMALLERIDTLFGDQRTSIQDYIRILEAGFSELKAGRLPRTLDSVTVGDLKRSRFDGISVLYIMGTSEGQIPAAVSGGGIFTDAERDEMMSLELDLAPDDRQDASIQSYYLYILMNKPRRTLYLSRAAEDRKGKALSPSPVLEELGEYLQTEPGTKVKKLIKAGDLELGGTKSQLGSLALLLGEKQRDDNTMLELYQHLHRQPETAAAAERLLAAAFFSRRPDKLSARAAEALYGETLYGSVSRIESYERCPYAHFLRYGLGLKEREQYDVAAPDIGNIYHQVLDMLFTELRTRGQELTALPEQELLALSDDCLERAANSYHESVFDSSARNRYIRETLKQTLHRTVVSLREQLGAGLFRTSRTELPFQRSGENLLLRGRIDRLDICEQNGKRYVRIVDYKSGKTGFDPASIAGGLQLQLAVYLDEALTREEQMHPDRQVLPGGMLYYHIQDKPIPYDPGMSEEEQREALLRDQRMDGLCLEGGEALAAQDRKLQPDAAGTVSSIAVPVDMKNGAVTAQSQVTSREGFENLLGFVRSRIAGDVTKIRRGDIRMLPYRMKDRTGCDLCPFREVCGFDPRSRDCGFRDIPGKNKQAFLKELRGEA